MAGKEHAGQVERDVASENLNRPPAGTVILVGWSGRPPNVVSRFPATVLPRTEFMVEAFGTTPVTKAGAAESDATKVSPCTPLKKASMELLALAGRK